MIDVHPNAIIHPNAQLADGVSIGPGCVVGNGVEIGQGTWIGPYVVIQGPTKIGKNNKIFQFSSIGDAPQDLTYADEPTCLDIGNDNIIREYCMINRGTVKGNGITKIGDNNFLMAYSHVGHDCLLNNNIIMTNYSALSGHVIVEHYAIIGAYAAVHQFCRIGAYSFIARATYVTKDVLPYVLIAGHTTAACGMNTVGLRRRGFTSETIDKLRRAYRIIFRKGLTVQQAIAELELMQDACSEITPLIQALNSSTRGITR